MDEYWPKYPKVLEAAQWTKHKGIVAKVVKSETGIGKLLDETEAMFDKLPAHYYSRISVSTDTRAECLESLKKATEGFNGPIKTFFDKLLKVKETAEAQAKIFKGKILIPKSSTDYVKSIANGAQELTEELRAYCIKSVNEIKKEGQAATK